jgi:hypothetical protein
MIWQNFNPFFPMPHHFKKDNESENMYFNGRNSELNGSKQSSNKSALASYE